MDNFINSYSLNAIIEYINDGYILTKNQDKKLKEVLSANLLYDVDIEKFIIKDLPEKYKYFILLEKCINVFKHQNNQLNNMPNTQQWLLKQTDSEIAKNLMINWKESVALIVKSKNTQEIDKKIVQIKECENYIILLGEEDKESLVEFINEQGKKSKTFFNSQDDVKDDLDNLAIYIDKLKSKKMNDIISLNDILKILKEQGELELVDKLEVTEEQYKTLFVEFKDMDKSKRNALMDLHDKYMINGLNQYLDIKPQIRIKTIENKNAKSLILEHVEEIKTIFFQEVKILQEQKLMTLSSKSEYLSQLKKQW